MRIFIQDLEGREFFSHDGERTADGGYPVHIEFHPDVFRAARFDPQTVLRMVDDFDYSEYPGATEAGTEQDWAELHVPGEGTKEHGYDSTAW